MNELLSEAYVEGALKVGVATLRCGALLTFAPIFSGQFIRPRMRGALALAVAIAIGPVVTLPELPEIASTAMLFLAANEIVIGILMGLVARTIFAAIEAGSALVAGQSGFGIASMIDPSSGDQSIIPATFHSLLAVTLVLVFDLHHIFLEGLAQSYAILPIAGGTLDFSTLGTLPGELGTKLFVTAIQLAAPALIISIATDLGIVLVGKAMPQVPILMVAYPLKMAAGLFAMVVMSGTIAGALGWIGRMINNDVMQLLEGLAT